MFKIVRLRDTFRVPPSDFAAPIKSALTRQINNAYSGRIIQNCGVSVVLSRIVSTGDERMVPGDGATYIDVDFEMAVFAPSFGEVLIGRVIAQDQRGIIVSIGFFGDIIIPPEAIAGGRWGISGWTSQFDGSDALPVQTGDDVRFTVTEGRFIDRSAERPGAAEVDPTDHFGRLEAASYVVYGSFDGEGLGPLSWWPDTVELEPIHRD